LLAGGPVAPADSFAEAHLVGAREEGYDPDLPQVRPECSFPVIPHETRMKGWTKKGKANRTARKAIRFFRARGRGAELPWRN
jgi:hypothetical protein